jgi:outer membrane protein OmpA-like peptidoglycan-associated protein
VLIAVFAIGGVVYIGYQIKEKVVSVAGAVAQADGRPNAPNGVPPKGGAPKPEDASALLSSLGGILGGDSGDEGDPVESMSAKDPLVPCTAAPFPSQGVARIPLLPGTVMTNAWGIKNGDVEGRDTVQSTDPASVTFSASVEEYKDDDGKDKKPAQYTLTICNADFAAANTYATVYSNALPRIVHDVTRWRLSDRSFQEIRSSGKTYLIYYQTMVAGPDSLQPCRDGGLFTRVEPQDLAYPMIVNDQRVTLPVIHMAGTIDSVGKDPRPKKYRLPRAADIYLIDDPADPLVLLIKIKTDSNFRVEITKIDYPVPHPVNLVEKQLTEQKRAVTYGIYFDFNRDTIKPESEPVLKEIVQAMTDNPDWKLTVEGHTDNIGGDAYNLDLSKRRAAAVKDALVTRYHIAADRLSTNGFGASRPVETNDTLEGRARNRRVELTRE